MRISVKDRKMKEPDARGMERVVNLQSCYHRLNPEQVAIRKNVTPVKQVVTQPVVNRHSTGTF